MHTLQAEQKQVLKTIYSPEMRLPITHVATYCNMGNYEQFLNFSLKILIFV